MADEKSIRLQKDIVKALHDVLNDRKVDTGALVDDIILGTGAFLTVMMKSLRSQGAMPGNPMDSTFEGTLWMMMDHIAEFASPVRDVDSMSLWYIKHYEEWISQLHDNMEVLRSGCDRRFLAQNDEIIRTMENIDEGYEMQLHGRLKLDGLERIALKRQDGQKTFPVKLDKKNIS